MAVEPKKYKAGVAHNDMVDPSVSAPVSVSTSDLPVLGTTAQAQHSTLATTSSHPIPMAEPLGDAATKAKHAAEDAELLIHMVETTCEQPLR